MRVSWLVSQLASASPALSRSSINTLVSPTSGRDASTRLASGVKRVSTTAPARTGFSQRTRSTPGEPSEAARFSTPSQTMRIMMAQTWIGEAVSAPVGASAGSGSP